VFAWASEPRVFTQQEFDQLTHEGRPVVIDVSATWCPTCRAQRPIVQSLSINGTYKDVAVLTVDFDANKPILKEFRVGAQSTLIAFKGGKETARSVGDTTPAGIEALFMKAVN
jgi:thioredoxin 1